MSSDRVGEVTCTATGCFQWNIDDFLSHTVNNEEMDSPTFSFSGATYNFKLDVNAVDDRLGLSLDYQDGPDSQTLQVKFRLRTGEKGKLETRSLEINNSSGFWVKFWMQFSELQSRRCEILTDGLLTVFCDLRRLDVQENASVLPGMLPNDRNVPEENADSEEDFDDDSMVSQNKSLEKLQEDFGNLLASQEECDVKIKVQGKEFLAHSIILRARSPVFKSMFSHEMVEKVSGEVAVDDCDPDTFPDFLKYLYTGSTSLIGDKNACQLYIAADKYQVKKLKKACATYMKNHLSIETFCDIIALALQHCEKMLVNLSTEFFCENSREITKTAKWQIFLRENVTVGNELFVKTLSRGNNM